MPPINTIVVQTLLLSAERRNEEVLAQAQKLLSKALSPLESAISGREYIIGDFSSADIMIGHACFMSRRLGCIDENLTNIHGYIDRIQERPGFQLAINT